MTITSPAFKNGELIPDQYSCMGDNINPPLEFSDKPQEAKSLALVVTDPDAPSRTFTHWLIWNIAPDSAGINVDEAPKGATVGLNDFDQNQYNGPCPPSGTHRYIFKVYALDTTLDLSSSTNRETLEKALEGHILATGELIGKFSKENKEEI